MSNGDAYLHDRSGARKSSGSYYTKPFAVEHLLDGVLEPALTDHFARLDAMDDTDAAATLFDFRVADIAMGSGHFLIAAIDRIERRLADYLARRDLPGVRRQLADLRNAATVALGEHADAATIEDGQLLRRMIARRCVYGVDANNLTVQLARLAVWIHTFVPGLPLSVLDHTLVHGNSLVGVSTVDEVQRQFVELSKTHPMFEVDADHLIGAAAEPLSRLANLNDATLSDIETAREAIRQAHEAVADTERLCDLIAAGSLSDDEQLLAFPIVEWRNPDYRRSMSAAPRAAWLRRHSRQSSMARSHHRRTRVLGAPLPRPSIYGPKRPGNREAAIAGPATRSA